MPEPVKGANDIEHLHKEDQLQLMEEWFREHYEDPAERTPRDDGEYVYIWGGPFDAQDVLSSEFSGIVPDGLIEELSTRLSSESWEWAPTPSEDDYDHSLNQVIGENEHAYQTFRDGIDKINLLSQQCSKLSNPELLYPLFFASVITALETYLSDTFINKVLSDPVLTRRFLETTPEFMKRFVPFSDVLNQAGKVPAEARRYLLDVVWHNLARVSSMYRDTLRIEFGSSMKNVMPAIMTRHDIVHRNGKTKDGAKVTIVSEQLAKVIEHTKALVDQVEGHFPVQCP